MKEKSDPTLQKLSKLNPVARGVLLVVGAYFITIWLAIFIISIAFMILMDTSSCSTMGRALVTLWIAIAMLFLASIVVVTALARKITLNFPGRLAIVGTHSFVLLMSYIIIAFGLLVAFNC